MEDNESKKREREEEEERLDNTFHDETIDAKCLLTENGTTLLP